MRTGYQKLNLVDGPMMFHNNYKEDDQKEGIKKTIPDILLKINQLIIPKIFMKFLCNFDIQGIELFPAIYIDDDDKWHENLWVVHCYEGLNCLDIENSEIDFDPDY